LERYSFVVMSEKQATPVRGEDKETV